MRGLSGRMGGLLTAGVTALVVGLTPLAPVWAAAPLGACCLESGGCTDLISFQCVEQGGSFIGDGTACATVNCAASVAAPLLSIVGIVAAIGALGGLGAYRLLIGRR